jgi:hypothetical protein
MKRFGIALLYGTAGYFIAAIVGYFLIVLLSSNMHDRSVEAAMTSAFVLGPAGIIVGFISGLVRGGRASRSGTGDS